MESIPPASCLRSPREMMLGWAELPRYIDKVRLHLLGRLPADYASHLGSGGFDNALLTAMGIPHQTMLTLIDGSVTDGEVAEKVCKLLQAGGKSTADADAFSTQFLNRPLPEDTTACERFALRKADYGLSHRADVRRYTDLIDADEGRM